MSKSKDWDPTDEVSTLVDSFLPPWENPEPEPEPKSEESDKEN